MDNEQNKENQVDSELAFDNTLSDTNAMIENSNLHDSNSLMWKIGVSVVTVIVVGILAFYMFNRQSDTAATEPTSGLPQTTDEPSVSTSPVPTADNTAEGQFNLGNQFYEAGQLDEAVAAYQKALELDPKYQGAYANLGVTYYQQQKFDLAASQYEKALELDPQDGEVAYNLGALYLQQALMESDIPDNDLLDKSITQLQQALEISPNLAEPHFTLGVAYFFLSDKEKATEAFESYLATGTDPQAQQEAEGYLQQLSSQ